MKVVFPDIGMIGLMNQAAGAHLIQFIFGTPTIKEFQNGQPLRSILETFFTDTILRHRHVLKYCRSNNKVYYDLLECK